LTAYLAGCSEEALDVIVSADTLVFFGSLEAVVIASEKALRPGGRLIFTVEELVGAEGYAIGTSGRYRHAHDYVRQGFGASNLRAEIVSAELRLEAGEPVAGFVDRGQGDVELTRAFALACKRERATRA
jgi:predicted TPR repeat methyltransferase